MEVETRPCLLHLSLNAPLPAPHIYRPSAIIAREPTSLEEEIKEIRRSGSNRHLVDSASEFEMSDIFYFARRGVESIMDDEVTKRFSAEELQSWNLLTRSNYNFHYISLRLTVLWGLGLLIRYGFLLPLRCDFSPPHIPPRSGPAVSCTPRSDKHVFGLHRRSRPPPPPPPH